MNYGPTITRNGLVMCLDAGDRNSYSGSGTSWADLSGARNNGTLTNGPTFNSANGGSIVFDAIDDYVNCGNAYTSLDLIDKSFCAWVYLAAAFASSGGVIDKEFDNTAPNYGGWGFWIQSNRKLQWWNHSNLDLLDDGSNTMTLSQWNFISVTYNSTSKSASFYINGTLNSTKTNASIVEKSSSTSNLVIGCIRNASGAFLNGRVSSVLAYNRILSASEVLQNFNSTRTRFGI